MHHNLRGVVTVRKDIEQIVLGDEIETREGTSLGVHEIEQSLFTNRELLLDLLKLGNNPVLSTVRKSDLLIESVLKDVPDVLVDALEIIRLNGQFLLDLS